MHTPDKIIRPFLILLFALLVVHLSAAHPSDPPAKDTERYKIGLVLSGGGAKGMSHVGVLRVMEEEGIKPDYITGTSMGSIVGALYSLGYSVDSIETMIRAQDWDAVLSNATSLSYMNVEEKVEYDNYIMEFPIEGWKPRLPSGAIKGHEMELLFSKLTCSAKGITDFDSLPIPFRAVATDMLTGKEYVFYDGDLSLALRSSMSIPTIMEPIRYKGMLLVDGGLVNNFPVEICKEMGADIIIGSYTGGQLIPEDKLDNMYNLLKQSSLLMGIKDAEIQRELVDIYIEPQLDDMSAAEFSRYEEFIERGIVAADDQRHLFIKLRKIMQRFEGYEPKREGTLTNQIKVSDTRFEGLMNGRSKTFAERYLTLEKGKVYTVDEIKEKVDRLYGTRLYDKISYTLQKADDGGSVVTFTFMESESRLFKFGVNYTNERKIGVLTALEFRNFLLPGSKLLLKTRLSEYPAARFTYLIYLGKTGKYGMKYHVDYTLSDVPLYTNNHLVGQYNRSYRGASTELLYFPSTRQALGLAIANEGFVNRPYVSNSDLAITRYSQSTNSIQFHYRYNTLDRKHYASKGQHLQLRIKEHWGSRYSIFYNTDSIQDDDDRVRREKIDAYPNLIAKYEQIQRIHDKWRLLHDAFVAFSLNKGEVELNSFLLGGANAHEYYQIPFWGLPENYTFFNNGMVYRISTRYEPFENIYVTAGVNAAFVSNDYRQFKTHIKEENSYHLGYGLDFGYMSPIGPISITFTRNMRFNTIWSHFRLSYFF